MILEPDAKEPQQGIPGNEFTGLGNNYRLKQEHYRPSVRESFVKLPKIEMKGFDGESGEILIKIQVYQMFIKCSISRVY